MQYILQFPFADIKWQREENIVRKRFFQSLRIVRFVIHRWLPGSFSFDPILWLREFVLCSPATEKKVNNSFGYLSFMIVALIHFGNVSVFTSKCGIAFKKVAVLSWFLLIAISTMSSDSLSFRSVM